jgi:hypothetical protein
MIKKKHILDFIESTSFSYPISVTLVVSRRIFEKHSNIKFDENLLSGGPSCSMRTPGRMDKYDKANSRFLQYYERA